MRKTIFTILSAALIAASAVQVAAAAEHHRGHKADRAAVQASEPFRNSNAYAAPSADSRRSDYDNWSRYSGGGISAPAGQ
jgi:hypothetical protein